LKSQPVGASYSDPFKVCFEEGKLSYAPKGIKKAHTACAALFCNHGIQVRDYPRVIKSPKGRKKALSYAPKGIKKAPFAFFPSQPCFAFEGINPSRLRKQYAPFLSL